MSLLKILPFALLLPTTALTNDDAAGNLIVTNLWARAAPPAAPVAGGYVTIVNGGSEPERLLAVTSPVAERVELHETAIDDGVARMRQVDGLVIAPGETVTLKPGGLHLMFLKPNKPLRRGERFPATFIFGKAGAVAVEFAVEGIGAKGAPRGEHGAHGR